MGTLLKNPITTQEALDEAVQSRLLEVRAEVEQGFAGWSSPEEVEQIRIKHAARLQECEDARIKAEEQAAKTAQLYTEDRFEMMRMIAAFEAGLPNKYSKYIQGETMEDMKRDAAELAKDFSPSPVPPLGSSEPRPVSDAEAIPPKAREFAEAMAEALGNSSKGYGQYNGGWVSLDFKF